MNPIQFKQVGWSTDYKDPLTLSPVEYRLGEQWYLTVPKSTVPNCKAKLGIVRNSDGCLCDASILESTSCLVHLPNDETSFISLTIPNFDSISAFTIYRNAPIDGGFDLVELLIFEGGDYDELVSLSQSYGIGVESTPYGIKLFFDFNFSGQACFIETNGDVYLSSSILQLNRSSYYGLTFTINVQGCYRLALVDLDDTVLALSNKIDTISHKPKKSSIIEYYSNGFFHRFRFYCYLSSFSLLVDEVEKTLTDGNVSISNTVIRKQGILTLGYYSVSDHRTILPILKRGFKLNGEYCFLRGEYALSEEDSRRFCTSSGQVYFPEESSSSCNPSQSTSNFVFEFIEDEKVQSSM